MPCEQIIKNEVRRDVLQNSLLCESITTTLFNYDCSIRVTALLQLASSLKGLYNLSQKHLRCKKGKAKKVQVTERPKDVISLWGQEKKLH